VTTAQGVILLVATALPAGRAAAEDVSLRFAWPQRLRCAVEETSDGPGPKGERAVRRQRYALNAAGDESGWTIVRDAVELESAGTAEDAEKSARWAQSHPTFRVDRDGRFVSLSLDDAARKSYATFDAKMKAALPPLFRATWESSEATATANASRLWGDLVQGWNGGDLRRGVPLVQRDSHEMKLPAASSPVAWKHTYRFVRRVACGAETPGPRERRPSCAELESVHAPDMGDVTRGARKSIRNAASETERMGFDLTSMGHESRTLLVTHPETMIPVRLTQVRSAKIGAIEDGKRESADIRVQVTYTFACEPEAPEPTTARPAR
jgi:hypothetical protein